MARGWESNLEQQLTLSRERPTIERDLGIGL